MTLAGYTDSELELDLRWWSATNYLTVAQIYLQDNVLLREPLSVEHIKPRLLGHWGTSPGLSMIYTLLNRRIRETDSKWLYITGPGHGGPALVAATYPRAPTARSIRTCPRMRMGSEHCAGSSPHRVESPAM